MSEIFPQQLFLEVFKYFLWKYFQHTRKVTNLLNITFNIARGGLLVFLDDELTIFRNIYIYLKCWKNKIGLMDCEKDIGSTQNGHF